MKETDHVVFRLDSRRRPRLDGGHPQRHVVRSPRAEPYRERKSSL